MAPIGPKTFELRSGLKLYLCAPAPPTPRPRTLREAIFERLSLCHVVADAVGFALILPRLHCPRFSSSPSCSSPSPSYPHRVFLVFVILVTGVVRITRHGLADARAPEGLALHARAPEGLAKPVRSPKPLKLFVLLFSVGPEVGPRNVPNGPGLTKRSRLNIICPIYQF
jgi:hypothetical protein